MSKYLISELSLFKKEYLKEGVFLVLLDALKVPPHLLLVVSGKVFSISTLGPSIDQDFEKYFRMIQKRNMPTIFVQLSLPAIFTKEMLKDKIRLITKSYPRVDIGVASCLNPIKDFCNEVYEVDKSRVNLVFDLLDGLKSQQAIVSYHHLFLDEELKNGQMTLDKYSVFEVNEAIHAALVS